MLLNKCLVQLFIILSCIYFDCPSVIPECDNHTRIDILKYSFNLNRSISRKQRNLSKPTRREQTGVTIFDALKHSTGICAHLITFLVENISYKIKFSIKTYFLGGQRTSFLFKISLSTCVSVPPLFILTDTSFDAFRWLLKKTIFSLQSSVHRPGCTL